MTSLCATRYAAVYLFRSALEYLFTYWARLVSVTSCDLVSVQARARFTAHRSAACLYSAIVAMLGILAWTCNNATVNNLMAWYTHRHAVIYVSSKFRMIRQMLNMMGMKSYFFSAAHLARITITFIYCFTPFFQFGAKWPRTVRAAWPPFQAGDVSTRFPFDKAFLRAKFNPMICGVKRFSASATNFIVRGSPVFPTLPGAVLGRIRSGCGDFVYFAANCTRFCYARLSFLRSVQQGAVLSTELLILVLFDKLRTAIGACGSVFHVCIIPFFRVERKWSPAYCSVILQRMADAFPTLEIGLLNG
jgi:hypothetical protein